MSDLAHRRLRTPAVADYLGYAESTSEKKRLTGEGPPFIRLGRVIVYDTRDLDAWLAARRARATSEQTAAGAVCNENSPPAVCSTAARAERFVNSSARRPIRCSRRRQARRLDFARVNRAVLARLPTFSPAGCPAGGWKAPNTSH